MSQSTPLFRKPWGWPELVLILIALVLIDFATPSRDLLPFFSGYIDATRDLIKELIP